MQRRDLPTQGRLKQLVKYDPVTGIFTRLVTTSPRAIAGDVAGTLDINGYTIMRIDSTRYRAHRLAWVYMTGSPPKEDIDHRNGARSDNRWSNLREATNSQNLMNRRLAKTNKIGIKGVWPSNSKSMPFRSAIRQDGKSRHIGHFATAEEAARAYADAAKEIQGEFAHPTTLSVGTAIHAVKVAG